MAEHSKSPKQKNVTHSSKKISLTLDKKESSLDKLVLLEYTDINLIKAIQQSDKFEKEFKNKYSQKTAKQNYENISHQLDEYIKRYDKKTQCFKVQYKKPRHKFGRVFPTKALGFTSFNKVIRNTLMMNNYIDLDIKNAQIEIINNIASTNNIELKSVDYYCKNRDTILEEVIKTYNVTRGHAKDLFLSLSFNGYFNTWCKNNNVSNNSSTPFIDTYINDMDTFYQLVKKENTALYNLARKQNKDNVKGGLMALYLQEYETRIMNTVIYWLSTSTDVMNYPNTTYKIGTYEFDGIKLFKENVEKYGLKRLLKDIKEIVLSKTGFDITFVEKPIEGGFDIEYQPYNKSNEESKNDIDGVQTDLEAAQLVYSLYPHWKYCKDRLYVFDNTTGMWSSNRMIQKKILSKHHEQLRKYNQEKNCLSIKSYGSDEQLMNKCLNLIGTLCHDDDWLDNVSDTSKEKLLFNNGILYTKGKKLLFTKKFDPRIVFFEKINCDYDNEDEYDDECLEDIRKRFFYDVLGKEVGDYYIDHLARAIFGCKLKRYVVAIGDSNSGKSTLTTALEKSFGAYIGNYAGENLLYKRNSSSDSGQQMRWALLLRYKRIIISNEVSMGSIINGNTIKKLCGSDNLEGRLHGKEETRFAPHFSSIMMCNDIPTIKPYDDAVDNRLKVIGYKKVYVDEVTDEETELKANHNIGDEINTYEFQEKFREVLFQAYRKFLVHGGVKEPHELSITKETYVEDNTCIVDLLQETYEITGNEDDYIESNLLKEWIKENNAKVSFKKLSVEIKKYCKKNKINNVDNKVKRIDGKNKRVWVGIKCDDF